MSKEEKYAIICSKLGFEPRDFKYEPSKTEDDSKENPFSVLTPEECVFLYKEGYLD